MSTRSRIKFIHEEKEIAAAYIPMDGHIENFAPGLIAALKATTVKDILKNKQLIMIIGESGLWGERDEFLDYFCEVDLSENEYAIRLYGFEKELQFSGTLDEFAEQYG
jgi:hypothetical protein